MERGEVWWANLSPPIGSSPGYRRPVLIIQSDKFNRSRINTVTVAAITGNMLLTTAPGNVLLAARTSGLQRDSVINVSQLVTVDRNSLTDFVRILPAGIMAKVDHGLRAVLAL
jgi:mRNA interferase MazF